MKKRIHLYVSRKNVLTWLMAACMVSSAVARIWIIGVKGTGGPVNVWSQIVLPVAASLLYAAIALVGYGNSNVFSIIFSQALLALPEKKNEVSGLMIMGLFGGTVFPLLMGFASDAIGQIGAVLVMAVGVAYLFTYIGKIKM